jgi:hypothetical protein
MQWRRLGQNKALMLGQERFSAEFAARLSAKVVWYFGTISTPYFGQHLGVYWLYATSRG